MCYNEPTTQHTLLSLQRAVTRQKLQTKCKALSTPPQQSQDGKSRRRRPVSCVLGGFWDTGVKTGSLVRYPCIWLCRLHCSFHILDKFLNPRKDRDVSISKMQSGGLPLTLQYLHLLEYSKLTSVSFTGFADTLHTHIYCSKPTVIYYYYCYSYISFSPDSRNSCILLTACRKSSTVHSGSPI